MKTSKDFMTAANATVPRIPGAEAITAHSSGSGVFIDVRDSASIAQTGTIKGAAHVPRGMLEFKADPANETMFDTAFQDKNAALYLVCGAGGQAALAGKTLQDMGFTNVTNIGGISEWKEAGGPMDT